MTGDITEKVLRVRKLALDEIGFRNTLTDEEVQERIEAVLRRVRQESYLTLGEQKAILSGVYNSIWGLGELQPLLDNPKITEIMIIGPDKVYVEISGHVELWPIHFASQENLLNIINNFVSKVNRTVNESEPIVDARLLDGSRVNVVLPPIALEGPVVTIRKFPDPMSMDKLVAKGSITEEVAEVLQRMVKAKFNIFISGGTGSGKTTFLNALSNYIPDDERIITIEDSAELQIQGIGNLVRLETRNANTEGKGEVNIQHLIKSSLRMRPDRIVVGEVRSAEAIDMLQAMNTGHDGSLSTGHANSAEDMLSRLETMVLSGNNIPIEAVRRQIASALDIIIQLSRLRDKSRRTVEIVEVAGMVDGEIRLNPLYQFVEEGETPEGKIIGQLRRTANPVKNVFKFKQAGVSEQI